MYGYLFIQFEQGSLYIFFLIKFVQIDEQIDALVKEIRSNSCAEDEDDA